MATTGTVEQQKAIDLAVASIEKQFGRGTIMRLGDSDQLMRDLRIIPTGSLGLDIALGAGGAAFIHTCTFTMAMPDACPPRRRV